MMYLSLAIDNDDGFDFTFLREAEIDGRGRKGMKQDEGQCGSHGETFGNFSVGCQGNFQWEKKYSPLCHSK